AQIDIPLYIRHIQNRRYLAAVETIKERNPMPLTIGRICPHPCEDECRRQFVDEAVNINHLKRYCADYEMYVGPKNVTYVAPDTNRRVAIVGGGPGGLACACYLRRLGHSPVIFDMMPKLGGMLRYGIPEYRLPKKILDWEIQSILDLGVDVHYETKLGKDFTIQSLKEEGFDAIFVGIGAWTSSSMRCEGEELPGVLGGIDFLIRQGLEDPIPLGDRVVVVGGGNTAIDAARTSLRRGCKEVILLYRRTRKEMPANEIEIVEAEREGVKFHFLAAPSKLYPGDDGKVAKLEFIRMELGEPDASGRRRPVPIEGSNTVMDVDNVIAAIGQRADVKFDGEAPEEYQLGATKWATFEADEATLQTKIPYVFTGGDVYTGPQTVVKAIGGGRRAARSIHLYITGQEVVPPPNEQKGFTPESRNTQILGVPTGPRARMRELPLEARLNFNEVELGLPESEALRETARCLQCGNVCYTQEAFEKMFAPVK
ncbi:MAG: FAD-dependent oxidoreductase, partial [bacterium]